MQSTSPIDSPQSAIIEKYKANLDLTKNSDELYKWTLLGKYRGRPNLDAEDFAEEIKSIKYENLLYHTARAVMNRLASERPEQYRGALRALFNEEIPLQERISQFRGVVESIYRELDPQFSSHHDERTIGVLL